jgi:hypothetical protein
MAEEAVLRPSICRPGSREVFQAIDQCHGYGVGLPGEFTTHYLRQQCMAHGCHALNQLLLLLRVGGAEESSVTGAIPFEAGRA